MQIVRAALWLVPAAFVAACTLTTQKAGNGGGAADGATCTSNDECNGGQCLAQSCAFSSCSCTGGCTAQGTSSNDCPSGWLCVYVPPDSIAGYLGENGDDLCMPACGSCPPHWSCGAGATVCGYSSTWDAPQVTVTGPSSAQTGQTVSFHADATSPSGANIVSYAWNFDDTSGETAQGTDATHVFGADGTFTVQVTVQDDVMPPDTGYGSLAVTVCTGAEGDCDPNGGKTCCAPLNCNFSTDGGLPGCR